MWLRVIHSFLTLTALLLMSGCGYSLQTSQSPLQTRYGVRRIYISPIENRSYKPGVENLVQNELVRAIAAHGRVRVVRRREDADAILYGAVRSASYAASATTKAESLPGNNYLGTGATGYTNLVVPYEYRAHLDCSFDLKVIQRSERPIREAPAPSDESREPWMAEPAAAPLKTPSTPQVEESIWSRTFVRDKAFPGNNRLGSFGTTSPLINDSEFDRALADVAQNMMADLHESMLAMF